MARDDPDSTTVELSGRVPRGSYERFVGHFPQYGASSWFVRTALEALLDQIRDDPTAEERVRLAILESVRQA